MTCSMPLVGGAVVDAHGLEGLVELGWTRGALAALGLQGG